MKKTKVWQALVMQCKVKIKRWAHLISWPKCLLRNFYAVKDAAPLPHQMHLTTTT